MDHVVVTLDDIWAVVTETRDTMRDVKVKLDNVADDSADHETRIRLLERSAWKVAGAVMVMGAFGGLGLDRLLG